MKTLVAVMACGADCCRQAQQLSRETWVRDVSKLGDFKFFLGRGVWNLLPDEEMLDVPDDKWHIIYKTVGILKWMLERDYDMILKIDNDTFLNIPELAQQNYEGLDYIGAPVGTLPDLYSNTTAYSFIQGSAQWLSRKAARFVVDEVIPTMERLKPEFMQYRGLISPFEHSEDLWIAQVLCPRIKAGEIKVLADQRYTNGDLTFHFALDKDHCDFKKWMRGLYESRGDKAKMERIHLERKEYVI